MITNFATKYVTRRIIPAPIIFGTAAISLLIISDAGSEIAGIFNTPNAATIIGNKIAPKINALPNLEIFKSSFPVFAANVSSTFPNASPTSSETILAIIQPA